MTDTDMALLIVIACSIVNVACVIVNAMAIIARRHR